MKNSEISINVLALFFLLSVSFIVNACSDDVELSASANDFYNLKVDNAWLPILVRGNTKSGTILLYVQGGPGYPSIDYAQVDYPRWKNSVEKDFAIAYYDQRGFGNKQGNTDLSTITMDQYQKDITAVAKFLKSKYAGHKVVLFSHSWGGSLSYHYLINHEDDGDVDGLVSICGPYTHDGDNVKEARWAFRRSYLMNVARIMMDKTDDDSYWTEAFGWAEATNPIATSEERKQWNKYVAKAEKFTETEIGIEEYVKVGFASSYNIFQSLQYSYNDEVTSKLIHDEQRTDLADRLDEINSPVLVVAARFDDQAPAEEMQFIFDRLGSQQKEFQLFENSGHNVFLDEGERFRSVVREFVTAL